MQQQVTGLEYTHSVSVNKLTWYFSSYVQLGWVSIHYMDKSLNHWIQVLHSHPLLLLYRIRHLSMQSAFTFVKEGLSEELDSRRMPPVQWVSSWHFFLTRCMFPLLQVQWQLALHHSVQVEGKHLGTTVTEPQNAYHIRSQSGSTQQCWGAECIKVTNTVCWELQWMCFHSQAAACKPYITKHNPKRRVEWCKARCHWTLEQWTCVLWSDESLFSVWQSDGQVWVWWYLPDCIVPTVVWWRSDNGMGLFFRLGRLILLKGNFYFKDFKEVIVIATTCTRHGGKQKYHLHYTPT